MATDQQVSSVQCVNIDVRKRFTLPDPSAPTILRSCKELLMSTPKL